MRTLLTASLFLLCAPTQTWADLTLDQSQTSLGEGTNCCYPVSEPTWIIAQTFTAGLSGPLARVSLMIRRQDGMDAAGQPVVPGSLILEVVQANAGTAACNCIAGPVGTDLPSGAILASVEVSHEFFSDEFTWIDFDFTVPAVVEEGMTYALRLAAEDAEGDVLAAAGYRWRAAWFSTDLYPNGERSGYNPPLEVWCVAAPSCFDQFIDFLFMTWVDQGSTSVRNVSFGRCKATYRSP